MKIDIRRQRFRSVSLAILLFAVACAVYSLTLPMGTLGNPGAGIWPAGLSLALAASALLLLLTERDGTDYEPLSLRTFVVFAGFGLMAVFIAMYSAAGLSLATVVLCLVWLRWLANEPWRLTIILTIVFTLAFVIVFDVLLRIPMPRDLIFGSLIEGLR